MGRHKLGLLLAVLLTGAGLPRPSAAQIGVNLVNDQGATAPCVGLGPVGEFCAQQLEQQGFVRVGDVGVTGLTLGDMGDQDGVILAIEPGSPAAQGLMVGDAILTVDGKPVRARPGEAAAQRLFGKRGDKVKLSLSRGGAPVEVTLVRAPVSLAPGPASPNPLFGFKDLVDWRGRYIPCMGAGPAGFVAIGYCTGHFRPFGYVPVTDAGTAGIEFDLGNAETAVVKAVDPDSPAAKAGVQAGDVVLTIDGAPISASRAQAARERLFGKIGETRRVTVRRGRREVTATLVLAAKG
jgi:membrane-associated protease RseP (regulator of RpoE activity)